MLKTNEQKLQSESKVCLLLFIVTVNSLQIERLKYDITFHNFSKFANSSAQTLPREICFYRCNLVRSSPANSDEEDFIKFC